MRTVNIQLPRDILETLLRGKQTNVPFTITEAGSEPLRIIVWAAPPSPRAPRLGAPPRKEDEDV